MKLNHDEYVKRKRKEAAGIASDMLDGSAPYLEGAIQLSALRSELEVSDDDKDFLAFIAVSSESDHLPLGAARQHWSKEALERCELEIEETTKWAKEVSLSECKSISGRFNA